VYLNGTRTPDNWVNAAEQVYYEFATAAEEAAATRNGFSCALEARWADAAEREQSER
jgi:hypothetical protein